MKATEVNSLSNYVSARAAVLLEELSEECQHISKLLAQLEVRGLPAKQVDSLLGELSAAITHLHEHTRSLDEQILDKN